MRVIAGAGRDDIARVYIAETDDGKRIEFVESIQPPLTREEKWVLIVSTLYGCPVGCRFCDAGGHYQGVLTADEIFFQIEYLIRKRFSGGRIPVRKLKIQFARMGEPSLNRHVLEVLEQLPERYDVPGLMPSISTVAPIGTDAFFERLRDIKERLYGDRFQFQFSLHSTDDTARRWLIPVRTWSMEKMADYGESLYEEGGRKIVLNFALAEGVPVEPEILARHFSPDIFMAKITPVNPTYQARKSRLVSSITEDERSCETLDALRAAGYDALLSIGEWEENRIGSNCGQYVLKHQKMQETIRTGYTYGLEEI
jgi:23S rRNA (adenine2503-C2)-methyltransferase